MKIKSHPENWKTTNRLEIIVAKKPNYLFLQINSERLQGRELLVKKGQTLKKNELIGTNDGSTTLLHSPISGEVIDVVSLPSIHASGQQVSYVILKNDHQELNVELDTSLEIKPNQKDKIEKLQGILHQKGIVGLGGAAYPTIDKIKLYHQKKCHTLLINLCECEPIISCDDALCQNHPEEVLKGIQVLLSATQATQAIIVIEDNKPNSISLLQKHLIGFPAISIEKIKTIYPSGHEKQILEMISGIKLKQGSYPIDVGYGVFNVATSYACYKAVNESQPLISRIVTVSNGTKTFNLQALIGTPIKDLLAQCNIQFDGQNHQLIVGGPMNGFTVENIEIGIAKNTNCLLVLAKEKKTSDNFLPCIRCGDCMEVCPMNLLPQQLLWFAQNNEHKQADAYRLFDCIECGNCSFVCPSQIPLVQFYRKQKKDISDAKLVSAQTSLAKERFDHRTLRLERDKIRHKELLAKKREQAKLELIQRKKDQAQLENTKKNLITEPKKVVSKAALAARERALKISKKRTETPNETQA